MWPLQKCWTLKIANNILIFLLQPAHPVALKTSLLCLMTAPPVNCFIFGIRNKSIQMVLINFMRKEVYKNEVQQEIRLRSPGLHTG